MLPCTCSELLYVQDAHFLTSASTHSSSSFFFPEASMPIQYAVRSSLVCFLLATRWFCNVQHTSLEAFLFWSSYIMWSLHGSLSFSSLVNLVHLGFALCSILPFVILLLSEFTMHPLSPHLRWDGLIHAFKMSRSRLNAMCAIDSLAIFLTRS